MTQGNENMVNIKGLDKADVLMALFNASRPLGMGILAEIARGGGPMTREQANGVIAECAERGGSTYFDYLVGRVMKIDISGDEVDPRLYDRDNGQGAAARALAPLTAAPG